MRLRCSGVVSISFSGVARPSGLLFDVVGAAGRLAKPLGGTEECQPRRLAARSVSVIAAMSIPSSRRLDFIMAQVGGSGGER